MKRFEFPANVPQIPDEVIQALGQKIGEALSSAMLMQHAMAMPREIKQRLGQLMEICDDKTLVGKKLFELGLLSETALEEDEFKYIPYEKDGWISLACLTPGAWAIMRMPAESGDEGRLFLLGYVAYMQQQCGATAQIRTVSQNEPGSNN